VPAYNPNYDPFCGASVALTVPSVGAFLSGNTTAARSFCPNASATPPYFPPAGDVGADTTQLTATADGNHILGANGTTLSDIWLYQGSSPSGPTGVPIGACPAYSPGAPLTFSTTVNQGTLPVSSTEIDQLIASPDSSISFVTYNSAAGTGILPYYQPSATAGGFGTLGTVQLSSGALAPIAGIFSPDGTIFFTSTTGDDLVHMVSPTTLTDTQTINPKLTNGSGTAVPAQFLAVKSRTTT
jgi:hypothetical protein